MPAPSAAAPWRLRLDSLKKILGHLIEIMGLLFLLAFDLFL